MRIGIDFDNTLVSYERAFAEVGREEGLLPPGFTGGKAAAKHWLLAERPDGRLWETLQGLVYGRRIDRAELFDGVAAFLQGCRARGDVEVAVVSHKTERAHHDPQATDLRACALRFMDERGFFTPDGFALDRGLIHFEGTREDKVRRIAALGCAIFIDDLAEVLAHPEMPAGCRKILFRGEETGPFERAATWDDIRHAVLAHS
jgi:hypothetical protein